MIERTLHLLARAPGPAGPQQRKPGQRGAPDSPIRADFPDGHAGALAYVAAWRTWLTQIDDGYLTRGEAEVRAELYGRLFSVPVSVARQMTLSQLRGLSRMDPWLRGVVIDTLVGPREHDEGRRGKG